MKSDDHRTNAAIAGMNTNVQHPGVRLAKMVDRIFIQNSNYFVQTNIARRTRERISALGTALRRYQSSLIQNPHQLAGVRNRQSFPVGNLSQGQGLAVHLSASELNQTAQTVFFVG